MKINLILGAILIILSIVGVIIKPFTYWWVASILSALIGIVLVWFVFKSSGDDDPNHFRPDYFGKGTEYSKPQAVNHYRGWEFIAKKMKRGKVNIILCSPGSRLSGLFAESNFEEIIRKY